MRLINSSDIEEKASSFASTDSFVRILPTKDPILSKSKQFKWTDKIILDISMRSFLEVMDNPTSEPLRTLVEDEIRNHYFKKGGPRSIESALKAFEEINFQTLTTLQIKK